MKFEMQGWVITRPGYRDEPGRIATWYAGPHKADLLKRVVEYADDPKAEWKSLRRRGWRCEKATVVVITE